MTHKNLILALALALVCVPAAARTPQEAAAAYQVDPAHSSINFAVRHYGISVVRGRFTDFAGTIRFDEKDVAKSSVEFTAKIASVNTDVAKRDEHLRSPDFFDAAKYPELTFKSSKVSKRGDEWVCAGTLTIKGVSKEIEIPFKLGGPLANDKGDKRIGVEGWVTINRQDYGIAFGNKLPNGALAIDDNVRIDLNLEAVNAAEKKSE